MRNTSRDVFQQGVHMLSRRVIVCLDVKGGRVVKGVQFVDLRDIGDPVELAQRYEAAGADEIVFLDISASREDRSTLLETVRHTAERLFIPLTVGGGVRTVDDIGAALRAGADKVSINSAAVANPALLTEARRDSAPSAWSRASTPNEMQMTGACIPMAARDRRNSMHWTGPSAARRSVLVRFCSPASIATDRARATIWHLPRRWPIAFRSSRCIRRGRQRAGRGGCRCAKGERTPRWSPA